MATILNEMTQKWRFFVEFINFSVVFNIEHWKCLQKRASACNAWPKGPKNAQCFAAALDKKAKAWRPLAKKYFNANISEEIIVDMKTVHWNDTKTNKTGQINKFVKSLVTVLALILVSKQIWAMAQICFDTATARVKII